MKTTTKIIMGVFLILGFSLSHISCESYLNVDKYFHDQLSLDSAFSKKQYVDGWLANAYQHLEEDCGEMGGNFKLASDELITYDQNIKDYQFGNYSANNQLSEDRLGRLYETVRKASTLIDNVHRCKELTYDEVADYQGQGRFLRAYAYWALVRKYGPIPLIPEEGMDVSLSYEELSLKRDHFDNCIDRIEQDLVLAARVLPKTRTTNNLGRPTSGAALALRARVLLHAASPLFNGNEDFYNLKDDEGNTLVSANYDEGKWARAAAAAKDVIDLGIYQLLIIKPDANIKNYERPPFHSEYSTALFPDGWADVDPLLSYKGNFDGSVQASKNKELIFTRTSNGGDISSLARDCFPKSLGGGNKVAVTQRAVDAFYMNDGRTIYEAESDNEYHRVGFTTSNNPEQTGGYAFVGNNVSLMYVNREPRFYASIAFSGSIWEAESATEASYKNQQIFYYRDLKDGKEGKREECPLTGIALKKYNNKEDAYTKGGYQMSKSEPTIRYAEILLIYAEALNELGSRQTYSIKNYRDEDILIQYNPDELQKTMKPIRMRAGLPDFDRSIYENQKEFRLKLKNERRIELFAENAFRYTDLRRWKDASIEENQAIMGCNINIINDENAIPKFYIPTVVSSVPKVFQDKMYLWPFPTHELKRNVRLTQNPGW